MRLCQFKFNIDVSRPERFTHYVIMSNDAFDGFNYVGSEGGMYIV